jgi:hypothetical protein
MKSAQKKTVLTAAAVIALAALGACHDDGDHAAATQPAANSVEFSTFAEQTFALGGNTTPVNYDQVTFVFDADNNPAAFDSLLM